MFIWSEACADDADAVSRRSVAVWHALSALSGRETASEQLDAVQAHVFKGYPALTSVMMGGRPTPARVSHCATTQPDSLTFRRSVMQAVAAASFDASGVTRRRNGPAGTPLPGFAPDPRRDRLFVRTARRLPVIAAAIERRMQIELAELLAGSARRLGDPVGLRVRADRARG